LDEKGHYGQVLGVLIHECTAANLVIIR